MDTLLERFNFHFKWELGLWLVSVAATCSDYMIAFDYMVIVMMMSSAFLKSRSRKHTFLFVCVMDNANVEQNVFTLFSSPWKILCRLLSSFSPTIKKQCFLSHGENYQAKDEQHCNWTTRGKKKGNYVNQHLAQLRWSFWFLLVKLSWRRRTDASNYGTCCDRVKWFMRFLDKEELLTANRINQCYLKQRKKKQTPLVW